MLAPIAIAAAYFGGWRSRVLGLAALAVLWEWDTLVCADDRNAVLATGVVRSLAQPCCSALGRPASPSRSSRWASWPSPCWRRRCARLVRGGVVYAAAMLIAPVLLRHDAELGFAAILFLFAIVWPTDIAAYFVGRAVGRTEADAARQPEEDLVGRDRRHSRRASLARSPSPAGSASAALPRSRLSRCCCRSCRRRATCSNPRSSAISTPRTRASSFPATAG